MTKLHVTTTINGEAREYLCEPNQSMLDVLRDELGLTGTKEGCGTGDCGACSILVGERLVCACLMLGAEAQDAHIETIEGVCDDEQFILLKKSFSKHGAAQCGICTPGIIMSALALLRKNKFPKKEEVEFALSGVLCRCTGYQKIVNAVINVNKTLLIL